MSKVKSSSRYDTQSDTGTCHSVERHDSERHSACSVSDREIRPKFLQNKKSTSCSINRLMIKKPSFKKLDKIEPYINPILASRNATSEHGISLSKSSVKLNHGSTKAKTRTHSRDLSLTNIASKLDSKQGISTDYQGIPIDKLANLRKTSIAGLIQTPKEVWMRNSLVDTEFQDGKTALRLSLDSMGINSLNKCKMINSSSILNKSQLRHPIILNRTECGKTIHFKRPALTHLKSSLKKQGLPSSSDVPFHKDHARKGVRFSKNILVYVFNRPK